jgi:hypothetical protein
LRDPPQTMIGNPISPLFVLNSSLSASRSRCSSDILGLVALASAPSRLARFHIAPWPTPSKPSKMLILTSPGDPDPNITALCQELQDAAAPFDTSASVIPQTHSDPPSDKAGTGTTETVPPTQKENEDRFLILIDSLATVKKSSMLDPAQQTDPLQPVTPQDWINLIQHNPEGFCVILMATVTQGVAPAPPARASTQPAANAPRPILFCSNKADTPWQHEYISGTTIGATICMEACKAFILKPWQPLTNNMMVKMVNNFLDRVQNKCEDLAIYLTQIIQIQTANGEWHNLLSVITMTSSSATFATLSGHSTM